MSTDTRLDLDIIEALDFSYAPPCEHRQHDAEPQRHSGSAFALIRASYPCCGRSVTLYICKRWLDFATGHTVKCRGCGASLIGDYRILSTVDGA